MSTSIYEDGYMKGIRGAGCSLLGTPTVLSPGVGPEATGVRCTGHGAGIQVPRPVRCSL